MTRARETVLAKAERISGASLNQNERTRVPEIKTLPRGLASKNLRSWACTKLRRTLHVRSSCQTYLIRLYGAVVKVLKE